MIAAVSRVFPSQPRSGADVGHWSSPREIAGHCRSMLNYAFCAVALAPVSTFGWLVTSKQGRCLLGAAVAVACYEVHSARLESRRAVERERLVRAIEDHRATHGYYPAALEATDVTPDQNLFHFCAYSASPTEGHAVLELIHGGLLLHYYWEYNFDRKVWIHTVSQ